MMKQMNENVTEMNKKLEKNKVLMVQDFIERQETQRLTTLQ